MDGSHVVSPHLHLKPEWGPEHHTWLLAIASFPPRILSGVPFSVLACDNKISCCWFQMGSEKSSRWMASGTGGPEVHMLPCYGKYSPLLCFLLPSLATQSLVSLGPGP